MFEVIGAMFTMAFVVIGVTIVGALICGPILLGWTAYLREHDPPERVRRNGNRACACCVGFFIALIPIIFVGIVVNGILEEQLISAARVGDTRTVERVLRVGINVDARGEGRYTPLMLAAREGYTDTVKVLLRYNPDIDHNAGNGDTALTLAQQHAHEDTVHVLKDAGALEQTPAR